jgi:aspartate racemase
VTDSPMRTIGLLGGTSWESTADYYAHLNRGAAARFGPMRQAPILLHSFDFAEVAALQKAGAWDELGRMYADVTRRLVDAGAEVLGIAANTMHLVADDVAAATQDRATLVHIVDAAARAAQDQGASRVALLGTAYTMEHPFYADALRARGLEVVVPGADDRAELQRIVYDELVQGVVRPESREAFLDVVRRCADDGAEAALLACTEFHMLVEPGDPAAPIALVDTTVEHCRALLDAASGTA